MKIRNIRCAGLHGATPEGGWTNELKPEDSVHTLVTVSTDEGLVGWGSVFTNEKLVRGALSILEPLYLGENALEPERVSEKLHQHTFWMGRGGSITHAISGIDIALWDILGQATGQPVGRLLGGRYRERVRPYASLLMDEPEPLRDHLLQIKAQGFRAFKMGWGPFGRYGVGAGFAPAQSGNRKGQGDRKGSPLLDEDIVEAAREAIGDEAYLMVDAGGSDAFWANGYKWAMRTADMLAAYDVYWFEEPLQPDALVDYVRFREHAPLPIAGGEVLTRRQSFQPWLEAGAFDIVQPDVTKCGGISEERRIAWMAKEHGVRFIPHGWNTALGLAADLQLASAFPDTDFVEYLTGSEYIDDLVADQWQLDADGMLPISNKPGLGVTLDMEAVRKYTGGEKLV